MDIVLLDRENNIQDQFNTSNTLGFSFEEVINEVGKWYINFDLDKSNELYGNLFIRKRLLIRDGSNVVFGGEIYGIKPSYDTYNTFYIQDLLGYFQNRVLHVDKDYNGMALNAALSDLFSHLNSIEDLNINLECDITDTISTTEVYSKKTTAYSVLQALLDNKYEYRVKSKIEGLEVTFTLEVKNIIWEDRTSWENYKEYKLDKSRPKKANIDSMSWDLDINSTANYVIGQNWENYTTKIDNDSITLLGRVERGVDFNNDLESEAQQYLDDRKGLFKGIDIQPAAQNYFEVGLWDNVQLIAKWNKFLEFDESIRIIAKKYDDADLPKITFTFNTTKIKKSSWLDLFVKEINQLKNKVQNL